MGITLQCSSSPIQKVVVDTQIGDGEVATAYDSAEIPPGRQVKMQVYEIWAIFSQRIEQNSEVMPCGARRRLRIHVAVYHSARGEPFISVTRKNKCSTIEIQPLRECARCTFTGKPENGIHKVSESLPTEAGLHRTIFSLAGI